MTLSKSLNYLRKLLAPYERSSWPRSVWQLFNTFVPLILLWYGAYRSLSVSYLLTLAIALVAAGLMVRVFIIFHDCCHGSFFANRTANEIIGTLAGVLTLSPFRQWRNSHAIHHATNGNLDRRGTGDIWTLTVDEYVALPLFKRIGYRIYRNPLILFGLGPIYVFLIDYRFNRKKAKTAERLNTHLTNLGIAALAALLCEAVGWQAFVLIQAPIFLVSGVAGFWLFYVQHQFEHSYFEKNENWSYVDAALNGSSFYKLPGILQWFSGNIGYHHIHHLSPRVPNYFLERTHDENPMLNGVRPVTLISSLRSLRFRIWDEHRKQLMGFGYVKQYRAAQSGKSA
ncbi:fatty acid desaturase [Paenibacillus sp. GCM10023250]|uniref:fatty acid desaturase n=1 Tax=Paenibacillus sp. GCM10023250 TaxID=3252648 RepID=UPI0036125609